MSEATFATPGTSSGIDWNEQKGHLLLITAYAHETGIKTSLGEKDAIRADVVIIDGPHAGEEYLDTLVFPRVLIGQLRSRIGQKVLGRLGQGEAKTGQNPPWKLAEATADDVKKATAYLAGTVSTPASDDDTPPF